MSFVQLKFDRIAISLITVLIFFDLLPHPSLSAGIIERTLLKVQQTVTKCANLMLSGI